MNLVEWLTVQLDEDERVALAATGGRWNWRPLPLRIDTTYPSRRPGGRITSFMFNGGNFRDGDAAHVVAWQPARVLVEIAVKRSVLQLHDRNRHRCPLSGLNSDAGQLWIREEEGAVECVTVMYLAQPYRDRPGFREEWAL